MKIPRPAVALASLATTIALAVPPVLAGPGAAEVLPRLAVMDLRPQAGIGAEEAASLSGLLRTAIFETGRFDLLNREDLESVAEHHAIEMDVCAEDSCLLALGSLLGAELLVVGDVGELFDGYVINARLVELRGASLRNRAVASVTTSSGLAAFAAAMRVLSARLAGLDADSGNAGAARVRGLGEASPGESRYWISSTGKTHTRHCRFFGVGAGGHSAAGSGVDCKLCGGAAAERAAPARRYWISGTGKTHRPGCRHYGAGRGRYSSTPSRVDCKLCGGASPRGD